MIPAELMYEGWEDVVKESTGFPVEDILNLPWIDLEVYRRTIVKAMKALYECHPFAGEKL